MAEWESVQRYAAEALRSSARELDMDPLTLAKRLQDGEIARLIRLLNAAGAQVANPALRHRIEDVLSAVTDGRMPMFEKPESELDWALGALRRRRGSEPDEDPQVPAGSELD